MYSEGFYSTDICWSHQVLASGGTKGLIEAFSLEALLREVDFRHQTENGGTLHLVIWNTTQLQRHKAHWVKQGWHKARRQRANLIEYIDCSIAARALKSGHAFWYFWRTHSNYLLCFRIEEGFPLTVPINTFCNNSEAVRAWGCARLPLLGKVQVAAFPGSSKSG